MIQAGKKKKNNLQTKLLSKDSKQQNSTLDTLNNSLYFLISFVSVPGYIANHVKKKIFTSSILTI